VLCTFSRAANVPLALMRLPSQESALVGDSVTTMRTLRHPITVFLVAVLVVIGIGVGVLALSGARLQPAATLQTPASVLALAKLGTEGTFSAVYQLSGGPSNTKNEIATVTVAQRSPAGTSPSFSRGLGEWSYRLATADGTDVEWVVHGSSLEDCMRWRSSGLLRCTGPASYDEAYGSNGYIIATTPFLPETAFNSISYAVQGMPPHHRLAVRTEQSSFGPLTCVTVSNGQDTWCLMRDGRLASFTGVGYVAFLWGRYRLISEQATAPASDFDLSGIPKEPFILPMP
jgi:hypothetical protein